MLGLALVGPESRVLAIWPASGISVAVLLLFGFRMWPGIVLGTLMASVASRESAAFITVLGLGTLAESMAAYFLLKRVGFCNSLERIYDVLALIVLAAFFSTIVGAAVHLSGLKLMDPGVFATGDLPKTALLCWLAHVLGIILFLPLITFRVQSPSIRWPSANVFEVAAIMAATGMASFAAFYWQNTSGDSNYRFLILPFVIWATFRYGTRGAASSILLVAVIGILGNLYAWGNFTPKEPSLDGLFMLQVFLAVLSLTGLILAATISERLASLATLRDSESRYRSLFENNPHLMFVFRPGDFRILAANIIAAKKLQRPAGELQTKTLDSLVKQDSVQALSVLRKASLEGRALQADIVFKVERGSDLFCTCTASMVVFTGEEAILLIAEDVTEQMHTREALHDLEQKLTLHMQQTALGVIEWTTDFRIIEWNPAAEKIFGYSAHEAKGRNGLDLLVPDSDRELVRQVWDDLIHQRGGTTSTNANLTKNGRIIVCEWFNTPLVDRRGKVIGVQSVTHDITLRERAEEALRESEEKFRNIIESSPMGIHIFELSEDGKLLLIGGNSAADRIFGVAHQQYIGCEIEEAFPMLKGTDIPNRYREVARDGGAWNADHVTYVGNEVSGAYEVTAFQSGPGKVVSMLLDVTERRRMEEALRLREKAMEAITQGIVIHANIAAQDNPIIYANPAFEQITGYPRGEILGKSWRLLYGEHTSSSERQEMDEAFFERRSTLLSMQLHKKNGEVFQASVTISPIKDEEGRVTHFASVLSDVTALRKLEAQFRQSQKMEAIGRLAGGVAHDFNNLLTAIIGYNDLVLNGLDDNTPLHDNAREIQRAAERAAALTGQLLSFSRQQSLLPQIVDLNGIVSGLQKMLGRLIGEGIEIRAELMEDLPPIKCEPGQIEQVIMNMAINARDAMAGRGVLTIHTGLVSINERLSGGVGGLETGNYVLLAISDTGCGMTREVREHLFEPFFTTKEKGKGTGLGLATCYGIIKQNGGDIRVQTEPGVGTTFEIFLPAVESETVEIRKEEAPGGVLGGSERILVVEDDAAVRPLTVSILESLGYEVLEASDGLAAIEMIQAGGKEIDMVVTDVVMPNMGGKELADWLRARQPSIRILFTSGYIESTLSRKDIGRNELYFLQKPFTPMALARKVRRILDEIVKNGCE